MPVTSMIWMMTLTALVAAFPGESMRFAVWCYVEFTYAWLNARLFLMEWMIYRKLRRDFGNYGIQIPPFEFKPLKRRDS